MKSLRIRLALWFGLSFLCVTAVFTVVTYWKLDSELRLKTWQRDYPEHPDWKLHGSYSEAELRDISGELLSASLLASIPLVILAAAIGYWLAKKSLKPIANVNRQLELKTPSNLSEPIELPEADREFQGLQRQLNDLLRRLDASFVEMNNYAAKVSHELRTPLAILRLKIEQSEGSIRPELADEFQSELHRLSHVVDQSLLIARADQGRLSAQCEPCDLVAVVSDIVEDFQLLAREENRCLTLMSGPSVFVKADPRHLRQIIHSLLANALKHGQGDFTVNVRTLTARPSLTIVNRVEWCAVNEEFTLGLGLRVVEVLLRLDPDIKFIRRRGNSYHAVRLSFPMTSPGEKRESVSASRTEPANVSGKNDPADCENFFI